MGRGGLTLWRVRLRTRSAALSAWQADTVWGHLCCALADLEGPDAVADWLGDYRRAAPPLLLSDGFPGDALPVPILPGPEQPEETAAEKRLKPEWLNKESFLKSLADGVIVPHERPLRPWEQTVRWKNTVSRASWSSIAEKNATGLFALRERRPANVEGVITVYVRVTSEAKPLAERLFARVAEGGFGKRRAVGYGAIEDVTWEPEDRLGEAPPGANGWVTLSAFIPGEGDPTRGAWGLRLKHGRFGDGHENPWKVPLLFVATGSTFYDEQPRPWYGGLIHGIATNASGGPDRTRGVQYAYAFAIPARLCT